jgi:hypothetical protein
VGADPVNDPLMTPGPAAALARAGAGVRPGTGFSLNRLVLSLGTDGQLLILNGSPAGTGPGRHLPGSARVRHGRPARLALRVLAAALVALLVLHIRAGTPPTAALLTGIATWLILTAPSDLAPPPGR